MKWSGVLRLDESDGAVLTVTERLAKSGPFIDLGEYDRLFGLTTGGKRVTLMSCFDQSPERIYANEVVVGLHCETHDPRLSSVTAEFEHLALWYGASALTLDSSVPLPHAQVRYDKPQVIQLYQDGTFTVALESWLKLKLGGTSGRLREVIHLCISTNQPTPLTAFHRVAQSCQDLLSIACQSLCQRRRLTLIRETSDADARRESGTLFTIPALDEEIPHAPRFKGDLLFDLHDLDGRVTDIFGAWLTHSDALQSARRLYMAGVYGRGFLETKFITLSQAAEALHRAVSPSSLYLDDADYRTNILPKLLAAIPTTLGADHRLSLQKRLEFGNEISLRRRLRTLCDKHAAAIGVVTGKVRPWVDAIVDCRNHLTHNPIGGSRSVTPDDLLKYNYVLKLLLECEFLSVMRLGQDEIEAVVKRCHRYQQVARRFFRRQP